MSKISLNKREKILVFILGFLIVISLAYTFFFNEQLEKWSTQKVIYDSVQIMVDDMSQSDAELGEKEKYIEGLKAAAEKLVVGYYLGYSNHMAEQKITAILNQEGLNPSYVDIGDINNSPFSPYATSSENELTVNASRIAVSFDASGSLDKLISLLTTIDKDKGLSLSYFNLSDDGEGTFYINVSLDMLLGSSQGAIDE